MSSILTAVRRSLSVVLLAAVVGGAYAWWRDRRQNELAPPEWPPLTPAGRTDATASHAATTPVASGTAAASADTAVPGTAPADPPPSEPSDPAVDGTETGSSTAASFVNALVDAPEARSNDGAAGGWVDPLDDGSCPIGHPVKANDNSGIFHVPDGRFYERTKAERCYSSAEAATADGYRQAKH